MAHGAHPNNPHPSSDEVQAQARVTLGGQTLRDLTAGLIGTKVPGRFDIADAVVSEALGLPANGGKAFRLEQGLAALGLADLAALQPRVEGMLAFARAYADSRRG